MNIVVEFLNNLWFMVAESAPWLVLGFLIAGVINQLVPSKWISTSLGKTGFASVIRAAFVGAPLPLCSCGVIPTAMGIRRAGASRGATASFLVATPETGVDSVSLSYALMGPVMAIARPVSAIISAVVSGSLVEFLTRGVPETPAAPTKKSCCCGSSGKPTEPQAMSALATVHKHVKAVLAFSFGKLLKDIVLWLAIGLLGAALIKTFVPVSFFAQWGSGVLAMVAMVIVGIPMYICATASTPLGASLMLAGVSPGAALVFMLTGPATNIATLGLIRAELGARALAGYLLGLIGSAILLGLSLDALLSIYHWPMPVLTGHEHSSISSLGSISGVFLIAASLWSFRPQRWQLGRA